MTPFLKQVANHYHPAPEISRMCFIFPNKRAISFFRKYLAEECARTQKVMIAPECLTINDFFSRLSEMRTADRLTSLLTLYDCYKELNPAAETLDEFMFWGGIILNDFAEVDKYRVAPGQLFQNIADYRHLQGDFDFLEPAQREAMEHFLGQFEKDGEYKERFRRIWDILLPLYDSFRERMASSGMATEGGVYRQIADCLDSKPVADLLSKHFPETQKYVFVGLNALNECEKRVLRKMRDAHLAEFCWDFSSDEIKDPANRSSFFLSQNVAEFPQAFTPDPDGLPRPVVNVVACPSSVGQTKLLPTILAAGCGYTPLGSSASPHPTIDSVDGPPASVPRVARPSEGIPAPATGIETAVVLPDEGLLVPVLNSIPEQIRDVNVTMGYPMKGSEFEALLNNIVALQLNLREKDGKVLFYHKYVWGIFSNSLVRSSVSEAGAEIIRRIRSEARYFIDSASFAGDSLLECIFRPAEDIPAYLKELILNLAHLLKQQEGKEMELDFAMYSYKAVTRLQDLGPDVQPRTCWKLIGQMTGRAAVPFKGEPLKGMQIMGPLETRALDFDNVIILSCNEGLFPRRAVSPSFIPAELRKGFGLPTYEYQDSVWAYYFYRLIQRAGNIWLLYDTRTELSRSGEESRYIRQLQMLYDFDIRQYSLKAPIRESVPETAIQKTEEDIAAMHAPGFRLSVSAVQNYLNCPAQFYYSRVKGLKAADEVNESLDAGMLGSVLHETMEELYTGMETVSRKYLESLLEDDGSVRGIISRKIKEQLRTDEVQGRNLIFEEIITRYAMQILRTDLGLLKEAGKDGFQVLGLELEKTLKIGNFTFLGYIDRLDSFDAGAVRIVDYKTGKVTEEDIDVTDANAAEVADKLFGTENKDRPKIALQLYLYGEYLKGDKLVAGKEMQNCIYQTTDIFRQKPKSIPRSPEFCRRAGERLEAVLKEMEDRSVPWKRTEDSKTCEWCDFKTICGR